MHTTFVISNFLNFLNFMQVLGSQWWVILSNVCSDPYLLLPIPSHFSSTCASYFHPWLGCMIVNTCAHILEFPQWEHKLSNQNLYFVYFFIKVDPTEEKGVPHPFLPSQGDPSLLFSTRAQELLLLLLSRVAHPPPPCLPCPFHAGSREEGRVMWEYLCGGGECNECT